MKQTCYKILVALLLMLTGSGARAQLISTIAGTGAPGAFSSGGPATAADLSGPVGIAVDQGNGDIYFTDSANNVVRKVDAVTKAITIVAGGGSSINYTWAGSATDPLNSGLYNPVGVAVDGFHNVFFTEYGDGLVREVIHSTGNMRTIAGNGSSGHSGDGGPAEGLGSTAELANPYGVRVDNSGRVYISDRQNNVIRKVIIGDTIGTVAGLNNGVAGFTYDGGPATACDMRQPTGVAMDAAGNIYIADQTYNVVRKISAGDSQISTIAGNILKGAGFSGDGLAATIAQLNAPTGVAVDAAGNVYIADRDNNRIRKVTPGGIITTVAGNATAIYGADGVAAISTGLNHPTGVYYDATRGMFIADAGDNRIRLVNLAGIINTVAGNGTSGYAEDAGPATVAEFNTPMGTAYNTATGDLYIADSANNVVRMISAAGNVSTVAGVYGLPGYNGDGTATTHYLNGPMGVAYKNILGVSYIYIADAGNNVIRVLSGTTLTTVAGDTTAGYSVGSSALTSHLNHPTGVAVDPNPTGNVYIADRNNQVIRVLTGTSLTTIAGMPGVIGNTGDFGMADTATFNNPTGVAVDTAGNIYVADAGNNRVRVFTYGGSMNAYAGNGATGASGDGGAASSANLTYPTGVAVNNATGTIVYIADAGNSRIRMVNNAALPTPTITTVVGNGGSGYAGDGSISTSALVKIDSATGIAVDPTGDLYIPDTRNNVVRKVNGSSIISTIGGNFLFHGVAGYGGAATSAQLNNPTGITYDRADSNLYIADASNNRVRIMDKYNVLTPFAGVGTRTHGPGVYGLGGDGGLADSGQISNPTGVAYDTTNHLLYICENDSSDIRVVPTTGARIINTMAGNPHVPKYSGEGVIANIATLWLPYGVAVDQRNGDLLIADGNDARIRRVYKASDRIYTISGNVYTDSGYGGQASYIYMNHVSGSAFSKNADSMYVADQGNNVIRMIDKDNVMHIIGGNGTAGYSGDGGPATKATFNGPTAVGFDIQKHLLYIADAGNNVIRMINMATDTITTVAGTGVGGYNLDGVAATTAKLWSPSGVDVNSSTHEYFIADRGNNRIRKVDAGGIITTYAGTGVFGYLASGGPATAAELNAPYTIVEDTIKSRLYIADRNNNLIRMVDRTTGNMFIIAGNGAVGYAGDCATCQALDATLDGPIGVALTPSGDSLYFSDQGNQVIRVVDLTTGIINLYAGTPHTSGSGGGAALSSTFYFPTGLCTDKAGNLYVADQDNNQIRKIAATGTHAVTTIANTSGLPDTTGDGSAATAAKLYGPTGVAMSPAGILYIADFENNRVRYIDAGGNMQRLAGGLGRTGGDGGPAIMAALYEPSGVSWDNTGNVYISEIDPAHSANRVRIVSSAGVIKTTTDKSGTLGYSGDGGASPLAEVNAPFGICVEPTSGNYFIADRGNNVIREVKTVLLASFTETGSGTCQGDTLTFYNTSIGNTDLITWSTDAPGATVFLPNADTTQISFPTAGDYGVYLKIQYGAKTDNSGDSVFISATPVPPIAQVTGTTLLEVSGGGVYTGYQWDEEVSGVLTAIPGANGPTYSFTVAGTYALTVDSNGCYGTSFLLAVVLPTSLEAAPIHTGPQKFWLTPSMDVNNVTVHASQLLNDDLEMTMYDATGREILDEKWAKGSNSILVNGPSLAPGLYIIKLTNATTSSVLKWLKD